MQIRFINSKHAPIVKSGYTQALEVQYSTRRVYVSGQIPMTREGNVPASFEDQARLVWGNVLAQLRAADMNISNIVKVNTFISDRKYNPQNRAIRKEVLCDHKPALTGIICEIYDQNWFLEVDVVAEA